MPNEIERKFFVQRLPDLTGITPIHHERYFLHRDEGVEERITKKDGRYVYEQKTEVSELERSQEKREISEKEFNTLKKDTSDAIIRDSYLLSKRPHITIKIYRGRFEGLIRAEVEFETPEEAASFTPLPWMGEEMTGLPIARDSKLSHLTAEEFRKYL